LKYLKKTLIITIALFIITKVYTQSIDTTIQPLDNIINKDIGNTLNQRFIVESQSNSLFGIPFDTSLTYEHGTVRFLVDSERLITFIVYLFP